MGQSYAIPTKYTPYETMTLDHIRDGVNYFIEYAKEHPELKFFVTRVGCGLAGYDDHQIAPMFQGAPSNCDFPNEWEFFLED